MIDDEHDALPVPAIGERMLETRAARAELHEIDPTEPGLSDYRGPLLSDLRYSDWSRSALVRIAEEACLQGHLLALAFRGAVRALTGSEEQTVDIFRKQATGVAGLTAERLRAALALGADLDGLATVLAVHPMLQPRAYVDLELDRSDGLVVGVGHDCDAVHDGAWPAVIDADHLEPLDALVRGVDPRFRCVPVAGGDDASFRIEVERDADPTPEADEVALTRFTTGARFAFEDRGAPVAVGLTRGGA